MNTRFKLSILLLLSLTLNLHAEWGHNPEDFVRIPGPALSEPHIYPDGQGGVWVLCEYSCFGDTKVFHVNQRGIISWDSVGVLPFTRPNRDHSAVVSAEGNLFVMASVLTGDCYKVFVQKINRDGEKLWGNDGITIDTFQVSFFLGSLAADDVNGLYILAAQNYDSLLYSPALPFIQKISSDGELLWGPCGLQIGWEAIVYYRDNRTNDFDIVPMVSDGEDGLVLTGKVTHQRPEERIQFQKVLHNGEFPWRGGVIPDTSELVERSVNNISVMQQLFHSFYSAI